MERREEPLVWVGDERVRTFTTSEKMSELRHDRRRTRIRGIDVQPHLMPFTDRNYLRYRINARRRSRADGGDNAKRQITVTLIFVDSVFQRANIHAKFGVSRN